MKKKKNYLPEWSLNELKKMYKQEKNKKAQMRFLCAIHRKKGDTIIEISNKVMIPKSTVSDYIRRFDKKEISYIYDKPRSGKPSYLSEQQRNLLDKIIQNSPKQEGYDTDLWSTSLIRSLIIDKFKKEYSMFGTRKLLNRLKFSLQKTRPIHHKGDEKEQDKFKKNFKEPSKSLKNITTKSFFWTKAPS